jgi:hypothetical protein
MTALRASKGMRCEDVSARGKGRRGGARFANQLLAAANAVLVCADFEPSVSAVCQFGINAEGPVCIEFVVFSLPR